MEPGVVFDAQVLQVPGWAERGVGRYASALLEALFATGRLRAATLRPELPPPSRFPARVAAAGLVRWDDAAAARHLAQAGPVVRLVPAGFLHAGPADPAGLVTAPHWSALGTPRAVLVSDLIPLRAPDHYLGPGARRRRHLVRARWVGRADVLLTNSEHGRTEVIELLGCPPERVHAIRGGGVAEPFGPVVGSDEPLFRFHHADLVGQAYVLAIGGSDPAANLERLVEAAGLLHDWGYELPLVVVGEIAETWTDRLRRAAEAAELPARLLRFVGPVGDDQLAALYRRAVVHVQPALAEGLGLHVLEAAACGCPSLVSATTALAEVAGSRFATFNPVDARSIAHAVSQAVDRPARRSAIARAQAAQLGEITWERTAARALAAIDGAIPTSTSPSGATTARAQVGRAASSRPRARLALLGPLPPHGGGIGVYNRRVADALAAGGAAVDQFSARPGTTGAADGVRRLHVRSLGLHLPATAYDAVVATLGNSDGHLPTVAACLASPAWLWLHEVRLPAVATTALDGDREAFARLLDLAYPGRAPHHAAARAGWSTLALLDAGVGLTWPLVQRSRGVLVNSEVARRLLLLDLPPGVAAPPVHVLPPACPPVRPSARTSASTDEPLVVALGIVAMGKRPDLLVDAAAMLSPPVRLAFVGSCPQVLSEVIRDRATACGIADRVVVTGAVDDASWASWLDRAAVAVQLRGAASGETSAAVLEALAAGLPTVTNLATAAELPPGTVQLVDGSRADGLAGAIEDLLGSPPRQADLASRALEFARAHTAENLAAALLEATASLRGP